MSASRLVRGRRKDRRRQLDAHRHQRRHHRVLGRRRRAVGQRQPEQRGFHGERRHARRHRHGRNTTIISGGALAPGNSIGTLTVNGSLTFNGGATYAVEVSPTAADRTNVSGTATLTGPPCRPSPCPAASVPRPTPSSMPPADLATRSPPASLAAPSRPARAIRTSLTTPTMSISCLIRHDRAAARDRRQPVQCGGRHQCRGRARRDAAGGSTCCST